MALPPKDRPAWMAPLYVEDATQRQQNWKDMKISKDQLASLGKYAWNFYFALIKYNENAQQLRSKLRRDQGFNLFRTTWDIVAEVENGGWAQYWWNLVANNAHNMELKEMVENSINCMKKLFEAQPISEEELMTMKYKTTDPAKLVEDAADACNWNLLLQKLQQTAKGKNESQKTEPFRDFLMAASDELEAMDEIMWELKPIISERMSQYLLSHLDEFGTDWTPIVQKSSTEQ